MAVLVIGPAPARFYMPGKTPFQKRLADELRAVVIMPRGQGKRQDLPDVLDGSLPLPACSRCSAGFALPPSRNRAGSGQRLAKPPRCRAPQRATVSKAKSPGFTASRSKRVCTGT
jgi:hypothetical protein